MKRSIWLTMLTVSLLLGFAALLAGVSQTPARAQDPSPAAEIAPPPPETVVAEPVPAAPPGILKLVGRVPLEGEVVGNRVLFFFDQPLEMGPWFNQPAEFDPPVHGSWSFKDHRLQFDCEQWPENQPVQIMLNPDIATAEGARIDPENRRHVVARFVFGPSHVYLTDEQADQITLGMAFPAPVSAEAVTANLKVTGAAGQAAPFTVSMGPDPNIALVTLTDKKALPVQLDLAGGMPDARGWMTTSREHIFKYPSSELIVNRLEWGDFTPEVQTVQIEFNKSVHPDALRAHLTFVDKETGNPVAYDSWTTGEPVAEHTVELDIHAGADVRLKASIGGGLTAADLAPLGGTFNTELTRTPDPLAVSNFWWEYPEREGLALTFFFNGDVQSSEVRQYLSVTPELPNLRLEPGGGSRFTLYGDYRSNTDYVVKIAPGLTYAGGLKLDEELLVEMRSPELDRYAGFANQGQFYFPRKAGVPLAVESRNMRSAKLTLHRMFPSNLAVALDDIRDGRYNWRFNEAWSEELATREVSLDYREDQLTTTPVDVATLFLSNQRGVFCVSAMDAENLDNRWMHAFKIVIWTDLGMLAHWQKDHLAVFVHDLETLAPVPYARVTVYSAKNQTLGTGQTDARGMARLDTFNPALGAPSVVVAEHGDDYTFLRLERREEDPVAYAADMPAYDREGYDAFLYADRDIYRPGETARLHWTVRTRHGDALGAVPLMLRVRKPNGRVLTELPVTLSDLGTGGHDLQTDRAYPTGRYTAELAVPGQETPVGTYAFNLEEFVPNRIKVGVDLPGPVLVSGQSYDVKVNAMHLFGAPAKDRKAEVSVVLLRKPWTPEGWEGFRFDNDDAFTPDTKGMGEQLTDENGDAVFPVTLRTPAEVTFPLSAVVVGRVFELGGRAVAGRIDKTLFPSDTALGIAAGPAAGGGVDVQVAALRPDGSPAPLQSVKVTLEKQIWNYYVRRYYSHNESNWSESFEAVETRDVALSGGRGSVQFTPSGYGYYRVRVHSEATPQHSTRSFYAYGNSINLVDASRPSLIKLTMDKESHAVGETARLTVESPFDGKGVVVLQGEKIQRIETVEITGGRAELDIEVTREQFPNTWVEVTVIHAIKSGATQVYPFSSFAMANLRVDDPARRLDVAFPEMPEEIRPAGDATFVVETRDSAGNPVEAEVTLAAVDEGIHLVTNYANPDPYAWLRRDRKPDFNRAHYYDKVAHDFDKPSPGGGLDALLGKQATAPDENWIKPVALWSGPVKTGPDGRATVTFAVPEFTGQFRLVAVASTATALGARADNVFVRRPYMLRTSLPRFALPGDTFTARATVHNHTDAAVKATVSWRAEGALRGGSGSQTLDLAPRAEAQALVPLTADQAVGQGAVTWELVVTDAAGAELERHEERMPLPVRPPAAYQSHFERVTLAPGETRAVTNTRFVDDARVEMAVAVSANPLTQVARSLGHVMSYPYGCAEQTVSRLFPLYLLRQNREFLKAAAAQGAFTGGELDVAALDQLDVYLRAGIRRLFSMQTRDGGLSFWPGGESPAAYPSVYALHFLTLVEKGREFDLPENSMRALRDYVWRMVEDPGDGSSWRLHSRAYGTYALSLGGDLRAVEQIARFDSISLPTPSRFFLAAAVAATTRDTNRVKLYLSSAPHAPYVVTGPDETLASDIRNTAVELLALNETGTDPAGAAERADILGRFLDSGTEATTQESAFIIAALSGYLSAIRADLGQASATVEGPDGTATVSGEQVWFGQREGSGTSYTVSNTGKTPVFVMITTRGVPAVPSVEPVALGMTVERAFFTREAAPLDLTAPLAQTDALVVGITLRLEKDEEHVVVADLLPAGFEIENPRLDADAIPGAAFEGAVTPSYLDVRDDRLILAFEALPKGSHTFYYVVRAVTPGTYQYPPVNAECMYAPATRAASAPGVVTVQ